MDPSSIDTFTAFSGHRLLSAGRLREVALAVKRAVDDQSGGPVHIYDDRTGSILDLDTRGSDEDVLARLPKSTVAAVADLPRGRGRPKLGVVAREVTLLPRHWDWLNAQPGGASVALRKLVDEARRSHAPKDRIRGAQNAAYRFMSAMAGDMPGFEEATRALFANDAQRFSTLVANWPIDVRSYATRLAFLPEATEVGASDG